MQAAPIRSCGSSGENFAVSEVSEVYAHHGILRGPICLPTFSERAVVSQQIDDVIPTIQLKIITRSNFSIEISVLLFQLPANFRQADWPDWQQLPEGVDEAIAAVSLGRAELVLLPVYVHFDVHVFFIPVTFSEFQTLFHSVSKYFDVQLAHVRYQIAEGCVGVVQTVPLEKFTARI